MPQLKSRPIATTEVLSIECARTKQRMLRLYTHDGQVTAIFTDHESRCCIVKKDPLTLGPLINYLVDSNRARSYTPRGESQVNSVLWSVWDKGFVHLSPSWYRSKFHNVALSETDLARIAEFLKNTFEAARQERREACRLNQPTFGLA